MINQQKSFGRISGFVLILFLCMANTWVLYIIDNPILFKEAIIIWAAGNAVNAMVLAVTVQRMTRWQIIFSSAAFTIFIANVLIWRTDHVLPF